MVTPTSLLVLSLALESHVPPRAQCWLSPLADLVSVNTHLLNKMGYFLISLINILRLHVTHRLISLTDRVTCVHNSLFYYR